MSKLHPKSIYQMTRPGRIEPKFIGIAELHMQHKHKRKQIQSVYKDTHNSLLYVQKRNIDLSKSLDQKEKQLKRLENVRLRHNEDVMRKLKQEEDNRQRLEELKRKTTFERRKLKSSIQQRVHEMKSQKKRSKNQGKNRSKQLKDQLLKSNDFQFKKRQSMYSTIKDEKQQGNKKIDEFYRKRNVQSLNNYTKIIRQQDDRSAFYQLNIEKMNKTISIIQRDNEKKQKKISLIDEDIQKLNPLKSFLSSRLNRTHQLMEISRKSSQKTISSKRPSEILLDDFLLTSPHLTGQWEKIVGGKKESVAEENPQQHVVEI